MNRWTLKAAAAVLVLTAFPASAACTQVMTAGTWSLYTATAQGGSAGWLKCSLKIAASGSIAAGSTCTNSSAQKTTTSGKVSLSDGANCIFAGSIKLNPKAAADTITEATLSHDGQVLSGVGTFSNGGFGGIIFTMIKIK